MSCLEGPTLALGCPYLGADPEGPPDNEGGAGPAQPTTVHRGGCSCSLPPNWGAAGVS